MDVHEQIQYLAGSTTRVRLLQTLRDSPRRPSELVDRYAVARSTIHRNLNELVDLGWVRRKNGRYRTTDAGALVLDRYDDLYKTIDRLDKATPFRTCFSEHEFDLPLESIDTATMREATAENPHAALYYYVEALPDSLEQFHGISPIVSPAFRDAHWDLIVESDHAELIVDEGVLAASKDEYPEAFEATLEIDPLELYVHPDTLGFGLAICDREQAFIGAYTEQGRFRAVLDSTDEDFVQWAMNVYESCREPAKPVGTVLSAD